MAALNPAYLCKCEPPKPFIYLGEDTGLCGFCNFVYDESLYTMRIRQHVKDLPVEGDLHEILLQVDPNYQRICGVVPLNG